MQVTKVKQENVPHNWLLLDAKGRSLGRLATEATRLLLGKHKPQYVPYHDVGDHVVVINCGQLQLTGRKWEQKTYYRHSGFVGGIKTVTAADLFARDPGELVRRAVKGMLPKNKLQAKRLNKLKTYTDDKHQHAAQTPIPLAEFAAAGQDEEQESRERVEVRETGKAMPETMQGSES